MPAQNPIALESLESRRLLSASATLQADLAKISADRTHLAVDAGNGRTLLIADQTAVAKARIAVVDPALTTKLQSDAQMFAQKLSDDHNGLVTALTADQSQVKDDVIQINEDKGDDNAVSADRAKLTADQKQSRNDLVAGIAAIVHDRSLQRTTLLADVSAIIAARAKGSPDLDNDRAKLAADRNTVQATLSADISQILFDRNKFIADVRAGL